MLGCARCLPTNALPHPFTPQSTVMVISTVPTMATKVVSWALVAGHVFGLTTEPIDLFPAFALHSSMRLLLNYHDISVPIVDVPVLPLTPESGLNLTDQDRRVSFLAILWNAVSYLPVTDSVASRSTLRAILLR